VQEILVIQEDLDGEKEK